MSNHRVNYPTLPAENDPYEIPATLQREQVVGSPDSNVNVINSKLELRCPEHPNYRAVRLPKVDCFTCRELYSIVNGKS